jgi:hypothetical protein
LQLKLVANIFPAASRRKKRNFKLVANIFPPQAGEKREISG